MIRAVEGGDDLASIEADLVEPGLIVRLPWLQRTWNGPPSA
jgi:hypothetical protein